jgi:hypothetical protein
MCCSFVEQHNNIKKQGVSQFDVQKELKILQTNYGKDNTIICIGFQFFFTNIKFEKDT